MFLTVRQVLLAEYSFSFFIIVKYNDNMKKSNKQKYFVDDWLTHDDFKIWLRKDALDNKKA